MCRNGFIVAPHLSHLILSWIFDTPLLDIVYPCVSHVHIVMFIHMCQTSHVNHTYMTWWGLVLIFHQIYHVYPICKFRILSYEFLSGDRILRFSSRSLMGGDDLVEHVTHIVVDEVHERDRLSDFLLTVLRFIFLLYLYIYLSIYHSFSFSWLS